MEHAEIRALARMLDRLDYYRLLRIEPGAPPARVRAAYHAMRRDFHPDAYLSCADEVRDAVSLISRRVNEGYQALRDPTRRSAYDRGLQEGRLRFTPETREAVREQAEAPRGQTPNGRRFFSRAEAAERRGDLAGAVADLKMALTFEPSNPHFRAKLEALQARLPRKKGNPFAIR